MSKKMTKTERIEQLERRVAKLESLIIDPGSGQYIGEEPKRSDENDTQFAAGSPFVTTHRHKEK